MRNQNFCAHVLANFSIDLDDIQSVAITCWFVEARAKYFSHDQYSRERTLYM